MIGFDAIGQSAIGELGADAADILIFAPNVAVGAAATAPAVHGGASVEPAAQLVAATVVAPAVLAGSLVTVPGAAVVATSSAAAVEISATDTVPNAAVAVTAAAPFVTGGALVAPAVDAVAATVTAPFVTAGKSEAPAAAAVVVTAFAPGISISATISPAMQPVTATSSVAQIQAGNVVFATDTITTNTLYGETGSASIGEFAIGEGDAASITQFAPPTVVIVLVAPLVTAGKAEFPPAANVNITSSRAEIDSRGRKLRVFAIAS